MESDSYCFKCLQVVLVEKAVGRNIHRTHDMPFDILIRIPEVDDNIAGLLPIRLCQRGLPDISRPAFRINCSTVSSGLSLYFRSGQLSVSSPITMTITKVTTKATNDRFGCLNSMRFLFISGLTTSFNDLCFIFPCDHNGFNIRIGFNGSCTPGEVH